MGKKVSMCNKTILGKMILEKLSLLDKTQKWLADETGISKQHICNVLSGKDNFSIGTAFKIADCLYIDRANIINALIEMKNGDFNDMAENKTSS